MEVSIQHIVQLSDFKTLIESGAAVIADFYATWCGPCKLLAPRLETLAKENPNVSFVKIDVDNAPEISEEYKVSAMPTVIGFHAGDKVETVVGFNNTKITELVQKLAALSSPSANNGFNSVSNNNNNISTTPMISGGAAPQTAKTTVSSTQEIHGENLNYVYLKANFSDFTPNFSKILVNVSTRDQGWASVQDSSSFFDLRVVDKNGKLLAEKGRVITNFKNAEYTTKTFTLNRNDQQLGEFLHGENTLQLVVRSEYPGWMNYVKFGEFKFE